MIGRYILAYDAFASADIITQLAQYVKDNRYVDQWIQPYPGLYLIKTTGDHWRLVQSFQSFFGTSRRHIIAPIDHNQTGGMQDPSVWKWFNDDEVTGLGALMLQHAANNDPK